MAIMTSHRFIKSLRERIHRFTAPRSIYNIPKDIPLGTDQTIDQLTSLQVVRDLCTLNAIRISKVYFGGYAESDDHYSEMFAILIEHSELLLNKTKAGIITL